MTYRALILGSKVQGLGFLKRIRRGGRGLSVGFWRIFLHGPLGFFSMECIANTQPLTSFKSYSRKANAKHSAQGFLKI